jgi:hypothetical protein
MPQKGEVTILLDRISRGDGKAPKNFYLSSMTNCGGLLRAICKTSATTILCRRPRWFTKPIFAL